MVATILPTLLSSSSVSSAWLCLPEEGGAALLAEMYAHEMCLFRRSDFSNLHESAKWPSSNPEIRFLGGNPEIETTVFNTIWLWDQLHLDSQCPEYCLHIAVNKHLLNERIETI